LNDAFKRVFNFDPPTKTGLDVVHSIKAMHEEKASVFVALGGNFLSAVSDTIYCGEALQKCDLTVSVSTKLNRTHLVHGQTSLILPTLGRTEKDQRDGKLRFVTVENSMGRVHRSKGNLRPSSDQLLSEPEIVTGIAQAFFGEASSIPWATLGKDYDLIRQKISEVFDGFDQYTERSAHSGFDLPNHVRASDFEKMPGGRAQFSICKLGVNRLKKDEFLLTTIRSHDQFNTTIYGMDDRYRGIYNERRVLFMNAVDMSTHQLQKRDLVNMVSNYNNVLRQAERFVVVPYDIPQGNLAAYFPETNVLIPHDQFADKSQTPISKSVVVKVVKQ
ncbi:MAG: molybdopterin dinucleotide binding domain-containing protein, partial [Bacteroidota bacterium]